MSTVLPAGLARPIPLADGLDAPYWHGTQAHELRVQQCASCSTFRWSPEWLCYACHSFETNWVNVDASGVLFSFQRIWHPASPALAGAGPYITVLVELPQAGNIRMLGNYAGDPTDELHIGMAMRAVFEDHGAADQSAEVPYTLVQWTQSNEAP
jgi:uncharacterized OB-fold protein